MAETVLVGEPGSFWMMEERRRRCHESRPVAEVDRNRNGNAAIAR
jgi:hypothetical protein